MEELLKQFEKFVKGAKRTNSVGILTKNYCVIIARIINHGAFTRRELSRLENLLKQLHDIQKTNIPRYKQRYVRMLEIINNGIRNRNEFIKNKVLWPKCSEQKFQQELKEKQKKLKKWKQIYNSSLLNASNLSKLREMTKKRDNEFEVKVETAREFVGGVTVEENRRQVYANMIEKEMDDRKALMKTMQNKIRITKFRF